MTNEETTVTFHALTSGPAIERAGDLAAVLTNLDEGDVWPTGFALKKMTAAAEAKIGALLKKAVG